MRNTRWQLSFIAAYASLNALEDQNEIWNDIPEREKTCNELCQYMILISNWIRKRTPIEASVIKRNKNNQKQPIGIHRTGLELRTKQFYEHYQELAFTREEQKQCLKQLNTQLCQHCLIPCNFQYCNKCNLIYNLLSCMIYIIPEEDKPISSYILESELKFNSNSNSNNDDDKNNSFSSIQNSNKNYDNLNSNSNSETYITLSDLTKEQKLKWFSNNNKDIMPEHVHDINAEFDMRYPEKNTIKLEPHSCTCIDLKIALEIPVTTIIQLAFRSSLAKKRINIRRGIINTEYVGNIIVMLQNDFEKAYIIEPNKKIAQTIFLFLSFGLMSRIDVPVNMTEKEIVDKEKIISTHQSISIPLYDHYMVVIERKVKYQVQIFEAEATLCESEEIKLVNLYIPVKNHSHIKIPIYNNIRNVIKIPEETTIGYLTTEIEN
ncbi:hypothetical protein G9A89_006103 [Geosiphon pyriformis]|nr:hypothetical protein G9A89_006103 [Geosiphon pyriformis]